MIKAEKLAFEKQEVTVDPENLRFDERTLSDYIQKEGGHYDNFGAYLAMAERNLQNMQILHEKIYCERFDEAKENGSSDKLAEAKAKKDIDVIDMKRKVVDAQYIVNRLKGHLKAWDKNHDNAQSLGHLLRKQMDKLYGNINGPHGYQGSTDFEKELEAVVKPFDAQQDSGFESNLTLDNLY